MARLEVEIDPRKAKRGAKVVENSLDDVKRKANQATAANDNFAKRSNKAFRGAAKNVDAYAAAAGRAKVAISALGVAATAAGAAFLTAGLSQARGFNAALAETSTLIEGTAEELEFIEGYAKDFVTTFGGTATAQVQGFYQAISAGATDLEQASEVLESANRLAIAGVSEVGTSIDVLTSAINVYIDSGLTAEEASDSLFKTVQLGKTTLDELGASVGKVLPIAKNLGVSFDEVNATVATLTAGGISTAESVTGLRAVLNTILKPTKEASDLADNLGLNFSVAGLEAMGFAGFMEEVERATGGSTEQMGILFSSFESNTAALGLVGSGADRLASNLEAMAGKAGAVSEAFNKMSESDSKRLERAFDKIGLASLEVGQNILTAIVRPMEILAENFDFVINLAKATAIVLAGVVVKSAIAAAASIRTLTVALIANRAALLATGYGALIVALGAIFTAYDRLTNKTVENNAVTDNLTIALDLEKQAAQNLSKSLGNVDAGNEESIASTKAAAEAHLIASEAAKQRAIDELTLARIQIQVAEREYFDSSGTLRTRVFGNQEETDRFNNAIKTYQNLQKTIETTSDTITELRERLASIDAGGTGVLDSDDVDEYDTSLQNVIKSLDNVGSSAGDAKNELDDLSDAGERISETFASSFLDVIRGTKTVADSFRTLANDIIDELYRVIVVQRIVGNAEQGTGLSGLLNGVITGIAGGLTSSPIPPLRPANLTARASGGPVRGGQSYLVGEMGPERFTPSQSGYITPNNRLGGQTVNQTVNITALSDGDIDRVLSKRLPQLRQSVLNALRSEQRAGVAI